MSVGNKRASDAPESASKRAAHDGSSESPPAPLQPPASLAPDEAPPRDSAAAQASVSAAQAAAGTQLYVVAELRLAIFFYARRVLLSPEHEARLLAARSGGTSGAPNASAGLNSAAGPGQATHWYTWEHSRPYYIVSRPDPARVLRAQAAHAAHAAAAARATAIQQAAQRAAAARAAAARAAAEQAAIERAAAERAAAERAAAARRRARWERARRRNPGLDTYRSLYDHVTGFRLVRFLPDGTGIHDSSDGNVAEGYSTDTATEHAYSSDESLHERQREFRRLLAEDSDPLEYYARRNDDDGSSVDADDDADDDDDDDEDDDIDDNDDDDDDDDNDDNDDDDDNEIASEDRDYDDEESSMGESEPQTSREASVVPDLKGILVS